MSIAPVWPDRALYTAFVQAPGRHFDDPELRQATFARGRNGSIASWNGKRAIVFRAQLASGAQAAVRCMLVDDREAGARYAALQHHLASNPVDAFVRTRWIADGLRTSSGRFPVISMDWVDGQLLDRHIDHCVATPGAQGHLGALAAAWQQVCRELARAGVGHGDIHAGNTLVLSAQAGQCEVRLVDYDGVWVPGLGGQRREDGNPAFQHPARVPGPQGPTMDAFPNTVTYLCLRALASDPSLWRFHVADDTLLFTGTDLSDPARRDLWPAVLTSPDPAVRSLANLIRTWLDAAPEQYSTLDDALSAATPGSKGRRSARPNEWPSPASRPSPPPQPWPSGGRSPAVPSPQSWPPMPPTPGQSTIARQTSGTATPGGPAATGGGTSKLTTAAVILLLIIIAIVRWRSGS